MLTNKKEILTNLFLYSRALPPFCVLSSIKCYHVILATILFLVDNSVPESIFSPNWEDTLIIPVQLKAKSISDSFYMDFYHPSVTAKLLL